MNERRNDQPFIEAADTRTLNATTGDWSSLASGAGTSGESEKLFHSPGRQPQGDRVTLPTDEVIDGRFRIRRVLGTGNTATVYLAEVLPGGETVAGKLFDAASTLSQRQESADHEAAAHALLEHSNVIPLHEQCLITFKGDTYPLLIFPYASGGTMAHFIADAHAASVRQRRMGLRHFRQICHGVAAMHRAGVVHADLRPANLLILENRAVVADLGQTTWANHDDAATSFTADITALGYLLNQILGQHGADDRQRLAWRKIARACTGAGDQPAPADATALVRMLPPLPSGLRAAWAEARRAFARERLHRATTLCKRIRSIRPRHAGAAAMLAQIASRRADAERLCHHIEDHIQTIEQRDLLGLLQDAVALYPLHPAARKVQLAVATRGRRYRRMLDAVSIAIIRGNRSEIRQQTHRGTRMYPAAAQLEQAHLLCSEYEQIHGKLEQNIEEAICQHRWQELLVLMQQWFKSCHATDHTSQRHATDASAADRDDSSRPSSVASTGASE